MRKLFTAVAVVAAALALAGPASAGVEEQLVATAMDAAICPQGFVDSGCVTDLVSGSTVVGTVTVTQSGSVMTIAIATTGWPLGATSVSVAAGDETWGSSHTLPEPYPFADSYAVDTAALFGAGACPKVSVTVTRAVAPDLGGFALSLPDRVTITGKNPGTDGEPSYWDIRVISGGNVVLPNNPVPAAPYDGWCVDVGRTWGGGATAADVYSSYEPPPPGAVDHPENTDLLDFVLNTFAPGQSSMCQPADPQVPPFSDGGVYTFGDIQLGMWYLIDNSTTTNGLGTHSTCHARYIRDQALVWRAAHPGQPYVAPCGGVVAVLLVPTNSQQVIMSQVNAITLPTYCPTPPPPGEGCLTCCTRSTIKIVKQTMPDGHPEVFAFTAPWTNFDLTDNGFNQSGPLAAGAHTITEALPFGWELTGATCTADGTGASTFSAVADGVTVDLENGSNVTCTFTNTLVDAGCTFTQGYWKTHPEAWPVTELALGGTTYTQAEALAILRSPTKGDASAILALQLIAAKLNVANGADEFAIYQAIAVADSLLASCAIPCKVKTDSPLGAQMVEAATILDTYNNGLIGPGHCD